MTNGFGGLVAVVILYTIIQQFEGNILIPVLMNKTLGLNPLLVFVCMLFGGLIMGVFGTLLSVPIAVIFSVLLQFPARPEGDPKVPPLHSK